MIAGEELHREVHAGRSRPSMGGRAAGWRPCRHHGVEFAQQQLRLDVLADVRVADELDALGLEQLDAPLDDLLLSSFMLGMPYISSPPRRSARSKR